MARAAQRAGVRRFVFLSSIRAQSGPSAQDVLTEALEPRPTDAYGRSKLAAEQELAQLELDWAALRLTLVYGPGVKGNMAELVRFACSPYPLPLAALRARAFSPGARKFDGRDRDCALRTAAVGARVHCRRSGAVEHTGDDHHPAPRAGAQAGLVPCPPRLLETRIEKQSAEQNIISGWPDRWWPTLPRSSRSAGSRVTTAEALAALVRDDKVPS